MHIYSGTQTHSIVHTDSSHARPHGDVLEHADAHPQTTTQTHRHTKQAHPTTYLYTTSNIKITNTRKDIKRSGSDRGDSTHRSLVRQLITTMYFVLRNRCDVYDVLLRSRLGSIISSATTRIEPNRNTGQIGETPSTPRFESIIASAQEQRFPTLKSI